MSWLPCDVCHTTVGGKLLGFYFTVIVDGVRYKRRLKLCESDLEDLVNNFGKHWSDGFVLNRFTAVSSCNKCGEVRGDHGTLHPMYVTCYSLKGSRFDYYATYCGSCSQELIDAFALSAETRDAA